MLKSGQKRPSTAGNLKKLVNEGNWRQNLREVVFSSNSEASINFNVSGGADLGEFAYVADVKSESINFSLGSLLHGDIILEVQGQQVAGYTQRDVVAWLNHCCKSGSPVTLKVVAAGTITTQLREFLNTRYPKGSPAHELQNIIRDNVYLRTVPVTTREPREGEVNGLDYLFLSLEEFTALERSGNLLESGIYEGNHYGTPKPSSEPTLNPVQNAPNGNLNWYMPGAHPSSEGKRKRNRSNVEAMSAKGIEPVASLPDSNNYINNNSHNDGEQNTSKDNRQLPGYNGDILDHDLNEDLGPLPSNWEKAYTEKGEIYFIDHNTGTSHWLDPRLSKFQKKSLEECSDDELPYGWERIEDPHYGTYYIDHVNRRTQYENPVLLAKRGGPSENEHEIIENYPSHMKTASESGSQQQVLEPYHPPGFENQPFFTRNPHELRGERITTVLVKSSRGLGFTIVGGDENVEEFLQIKSVVPNGPAWLDGKLKTGDVLVYVNDTCLLGFTHHDMVNVFQSIAPGETVKLEVCRGYPLPFDPNDPNTEVVTTVAVNAPDMDEKLPRTLFETSVDGAAHHMRSNSDDMLNSSVKSMPDLCATEKIKNMQRPNSTDVLLEGSSREPPEIPDKPEFLSISIVKGPMGFGFTIADSAYGQKVKKILDRIRCKNLQEGDILVEINNINVRNMCHSDVVQVLKDCERNHEATVTVQRGSNSPTKNRKKSDFSLQAPGMTAYRSKTPTADLYSTQQKEIMPNRPKTPLVDTRVRSKTPVHQQWNNEDVKFSPNSGAMFKLPAQEHYLDDRMANINLNESTNNYYPKNNSFPLNSDDAHNLSPGTIDNADGFQKNSPGYPHPQLGYYNGYVDEYSVYDPLYGRSSHGPVYYPHERLVDGYVSSHHRDTSPRYPPMIKMLPRNQTGYEYVETVVSLVRQETGFGFRIVGGTEEGSQVGATVSIGHIVPGGAADLDGRLCTGDEILSVDGQSVVNTSHHHVVQLMGKAAVNGSVAIGIRRRISVPSEVPNSLCTPTAYPYDVTVTRREDEGFGFVIISSLNRSGSTIGRIIKGSPAERCGQLHVGDHILAVNHIDIISLHHGDIVNLIKDSGFSVTLTIGPPFDDTSSNASVTHREEYDSTLVDEEQYDMSRRGRNFDYPPVRSGSSHEGHILEDDQYHAVELSRGSRGFGFSIRGGKEFHNMPLYVLQIAENGPAAVNDKLKIGDQIIEINGINTKNMTHAEAIEIIRKGGPVVRLLVRRGEKPPPPPPPPEY